MNNSTKPNKNIIIGCTGSVATIKLPLLIKMLLDSECPVKFVIKIVVTERAKHFFDSKDIPLGIQIFNDEDEWKMWNKRGDPVLHIDLGKWADLFVIAPMDANSLAKFATGICDNLLMCTARAWDVQKPLLFCPAMNTRMYNHPVTSEQITKLKNWGYIEIPSISKELMCGDTGIGAMAEVQTVYQQIIECFIPPPPPSPHSLVNVSDKIVTINDIQIEDINDNNNSNRKNGNHSMKRNKSTTEQQSKPNSSDEVKDEIIDSSVAGNGDIEGNNEQIENKNNENLKNENDSEKINENNISYNNQAEYPSHQSSSLDMEYTTSTQ